MYLKGENLFITGFPISAPAIPPAFYKVPDKFTA